MNEKISKTFIILSQQFGRKKTKWNNYRKFLKTQFYSEEDRLTFQNERFRSLVREVSNNVNYYKELFNNLYPLLNAINVSDLSRIPFLTKDILREESGRLLNNTLSYRKFSNSTSGSSGQKTVFYSDLNAELIKGPLVWRALKWLDVDFGEKELRIWGSKSDVHRDSKIFARSKNLIKNKAILCSYKLTPSLINEYLEFIQQFKPSQIHSYPSSLYEISKFILERNIKPYKPKVILTSGEQLYEWQRDFIQKAFGVNVYNFYGCREVGIIAQECKHRKGLHIMSENIILEVVNQKGENVFDEEGEIVITELSNYVFPFIRYKILDRGILTKGKCTCGITLPLLKAINGRTFDLIKFSDGGSIGATFFTILFKEKPGIKDFRIIQDNINEIKIEYLPEENDEDISYFRKRIEEHTNNRLKAVFIPVENFAIIDSGKKQFIRSSI